MIGLVRNVFGGVLTVIDLAVKSEAMGRAYSAAAVSSWLEQVEESSEVLEPRSFVCNTRATVPVTDPADSLLRFNDIECDVCATEHADFPGAPIACGTPGCPNSSHPSAPGIRNRSAADRPEPIARADARGSGHQTSTKVVYIAGPMTGLPEFNYPLFNRVAAELRARGVEVRNPAENDGGSADKQWDFYIRLGLRQLLECDEIMLLPGWESSKGAQLELSVAEALGMTVSEYESSPDVAAGSQQRANVVGGVASADDLLPGGGTGHPLDREAADGLHNAADGLESLANLALLADRITVVDHIGSHALAAEIRDLAYQFDADALNETN